MHPALFVPKVYGDSSQDAQPNRLSSSIPETLFQLEQLQVSQYKSACRVCAQLPTGAAQIQRPAHAARRACVRWDLRMRTQPYTCRQVLLLDGNELTGPLSAEIGRLRHLAYLDLSHNRFYSKLPLALFQCTALAHLRLRDNQFSGTLPAVISRLHKLEALDIGDNSFSGSIPERSPSRSARSALHHSRSSVNKVGVSCVTNRAEP